jgi:hypothetical protein
MFINANNRYQAFAIHILISLVIFIILAYFITHVWYPDFLFSTDGGWNGIRLIAGIDFFIGPTLTLIIYKKGKPGLKMDLILIGLIQLSCLAYGTWTVYQQRSIAVVYANGEFLAKSIIAFENYNVDMEKVYAVDDEVPVWIYIDLPVDEEERSKVLIAQLHNPPFYIQTQRYASYKENLDIILNEALDPETLDDEIKNNISANGKIYPYLARYGEGYIEIDKNTGEYIKLHAIK